MMKKTVKLCSLILAVLMVAGIAACKPKPAGGNKAGLSDVTLWGMPGTEKVYRDVDKDSSYYTDYKTDAKIDLTMARGEYEGGQIIISADKKVEYNVESSALVSGDNTIPAENVEIFVEKYISVTATIENRGLPAAQYPDAIVPIANIKAAGENTVDAGCNQGIYVRVKTAENQAAGTYSGNLKVVIGDDATYLPVSVNVADVTVSQVNRSKSIFIAGWSTEKGELDTTQEMVDKYNEALFDYRLNGGIIVDISENMSVSEAGIQPFVEKAYNMMQNPKCSTVCIPYNSARYVLNTDIMNKMLTAIVNKCYETKYNMFDKLVCYFGVIDEPDINGLLGQARTFAKAYNDTKIAFANSVESEIAADDADKTFKKQVVESIRKLPHIMTSPYDNTFDGFDVTFCPKFSNYGTESERANYADQNERWWYGCNLPKSPYPTYHTDDIWLSARLVGWMQAQYDITGNLMWAVDNYANYDGVSYKEIDDYYESTALRFATNGANGDGYLFYPGKKYGIDGPVGSLRLEAIRDGLEEYEILYDIKQSYNKVSEALSGGGYSADFGGFMNTLTSKLYSGATVFATTENFDAMRKELFNSAAVNATNDFCVVEYSDDGYGKKTFAFAVKSGVSVKKDGEALGSVVTTGGYDVYKIEVLLENASNVISLTFENDGKVNEYALDCGGAATVKKGSQLDAAGFAKMTCTPAVTADGDAMKVELPEVAGDEQSFIMTGANLSGADASTDKIVLHIRYDGTDKPELTLSAKFTNSRVYSDILRVTLENGENEITLDLSDRTAAISELAFIFEVKDAQSIATKTLYINGISVYRQ